MMVSVGIGLVTGLVGFLLGKADADLFAGIGVENAGTAGFMYVPKSPHLYTLLVSCCYYSSFSFIPSFALSIRTVRDWWLVM